MTRTTCSIVLLLMCVSTAILSCEQNTPLADYKVKSPQEEALKKILMEFQKGVNTKQQDIILNLIPEDASIMVGGDRQILSKIFKKKRSKEKVI